MSSIDLTQALNSEAYARILYVNYYRDKNTMGITPDEMSQITNRWSNRVESWIASAQNDENNYAITDYDYNSMVNDGYASGQHLTGYNNSTGQKFGQYAGTYGRYIGNGLNAITSGSQTGISWLDGAVNGAKGTSDKLSWSTTYQGADKSWKASTTTGAGQTSSYDTSGDKIFDMKKSYPGDSMSDEIKKVDLEKGSASTNGGGSNNSATSTGNSQQSTGSSSNSTSGSSEAGGEVDLEMDWMLLAQIALDTVNTVTYQIQDPNAKETKALSELTPEMGNQQGITSATQEKLSSMDEELMGMADDASTLVNDEANPQIEQSYTDTYVWSQEYEHLMSKKTQTGTLDEEEMDLLRACADNIALGNETMTGITEEAQETVNDVYSEMETYQEGFDLAAENTANVQGLTDYAADFDERTQNLCETEALSQGMAAASAGVHGGKAVARALESGIWGAVIYGVAAADAFVCAGLDVKAGLDQNNRAQTAGAEIAARKTTQDMNEVTKELYDTNVDNYDVYMGDVADLEIEVPDDEITVPEEGGEAMASATPTGGTAGTNPFGFPTDEDEDEDDPNKRRPEGLV